MAASKENVFSKHGDIKISLLEFIEEYCKTHGLSSIPPALEVELYDKNQDAWVAVDCKHIRIKVVRKVENIEEDEETDSSESENLNKTTRKDEILKEKDRKTKQLELSAGSTVRRCIPSESDCYEEVKNVKRTSGPIRGKNYEEILNSLLKWPSEFMANISCAMKGIGAITSVGLGQIFCGCHVSKHLVLIPNHGLEKILESSSDVMIQFHSFADDQPSTLNSYIERQVSNFLLDKSKSFTDYSTSGLDFALIAIEKPSKMMDTTLLNEATILTNVCPKMKNDLLGTCIYLGFFSRKCDQFLKVRAEIIELEDERSETLKALNRDRNMILYVADTEEGYSGAPLFNDRAEIVGIHLGTKTLTCRRSDTSRKYHIGYGLLITAILRDLYVSLSGEETPFELMLKNSNMSSEIPFPYNQQELKKSTTRDHSAQCEKIKDHVRTPEL